MRFILTATAILALVSMLTAFVMQGGLARKRRQADGFWKRFWWRQVLLLPLYLFVLLPALMGCAGSWMVQTRGDEAKYQGPILQNDVWVLQDRRTLRQAMPAGQTQAAITIPSGNGPTLQGYFVASRQPVPAASVILLHGLFRSAMEVEPVAEMFRDLGAEVLLLNLRNHGGSESRAFTFGLREKSDLLAAVEYLRKRPQGLSAPLVVYGVSMGAVVAARAAPEIPELAGLVLDAPMADLTSTIHRQLGTMEWENRQGLGLPGFYINLILFWMELASGFSATDVRPLDQIAQLSEDVHTLFIGAGRDVRVPPPVVTQMFEAHQAADTHKAMWIEPDSNHGRVWDAQPGQYRSQLEAFLDRVTR